MFQETERDVVWILSMLLKDVVVTRGRRSEFGAAQPLVAPLCLRGFPSADADVLGLGHASTAIFNLPPPPLEEDEDA